MRILVIAAMAKEIQPLLDSGYTGEYVFTGVGPVAATSKIASVLHLNNYDLLIQAGLAGAFTETLHQGEVVLVGSDCFGDLGIMENNMFTPLHQTPLAQADLFPYQKGVLPNPYLQAFPSQLKQVKAVTVGLITDDSQRNQSMQTLFDADIESMEGAALHLECLSKGIPFVQLRALSNRIGERDKEKWAMDTAIAHLNRELLALLQRPDLERIFSKKSSRS